MKTKQQNRSVVKSGINVRRMACQSLSAVPFAVPFKLKLNKIEKVWQLPHFLTINKIQVFWRLV
jgi:hypothetical protein